MSASASVPPHYEDWTEQSSGSKATDAGVDNPRAPLSFERSK